MLTRWRKLELGPKEQRRLAWGISLGVGSLFYLKVWLPLTHIGIPCVFREITGLYCPGCGITRAALSLLNLDLAQAVRYNPVVFSLLPLYLMYLIAAKHKMRLTGSIMMAAMLAMTLGFGILRNIPAFAWLAPNSAS